MLARSYKNPLKLAKSRQYRKTKATRSGFCGSRWLIFFPAKATFLQVVPTFSKCLPTATFACAAPTDSSTRISCESTFLCIPRTRFRTLGVWLKPAAHLQNVNLSRVFGPDKTNYAYAIPQSRSSSRRQAGTASGRQKAARRPGSPHRRLVKKKAGLKPGWRKLWPGDSGDDGIGCVPKLPRHKKLNELDAAPRSITPSAWFALSLQHIYS